MSNPLPPLQDVLNVAALCHVQSVLDEERAAVELQKERAEEEAEALAEAEAGNGVRQRDASSSALEPMREVDLTKQIVRGAVGLMGSALREASLWWETRSYRAAMDQLVEAGTDASQASAQSATPRPPTITTVLDD